MKIVRSVKLKLFGTKSKQERLAAFIDEYKRVANYVFENYNVNDYIKKSDFLDSKNYNKLKQETNTWLMSHPLQDILNFCWGQLKAYNSLVINYKEECNNLALERVRNKKEKERLLKKDKLIYSEEKRLKYLKKILSKKPKYLNPPSKPFLSDKASIMLSTQCVKMELSRSKSFDMFLHFWSLGCGSFDIPTKFTRMYNKYFEIGKRNTSVFINKNYIFMSFEIETGKKKEEGKLSSIDTNFSNLAFYNQEVNKLILTDLLSLVQKVRRKNFGSKRYYRAKIELKEYINYHLKKDIDWNSIRLLVVEDLKRIKFKMSVKDRLTKNIRSVFQNLSFSYILEKLELLCEENRVSFRKVKPFYTSIICSNCSHVEKRNRLNQASFKCCKCGFTINADLNASRNILNRFLNGKYGSVFKTDFVENYL